MRRRVGIALLGVVLAGCGGGDEPPSPEPTPTATASATVPDEQVSGSPTVAPSPAPAEDPTPADVGPTPLGSGCAPGTPDTLPDGRWFGVLVAASADTLTFDLACWYVGEDAVAVSVERGDGPEVPNDYYVVNDNPGLRTLPVTGLTVARRISGTTDISLTEDVGWDEFLSEPGAFAPCPGEFCLVWLATSDGAVDLVEVQFVP